MSSTEPDNKLLTALSPSARSKFVNGCARVELVPGQTLAIPGERITHVYFPISGYISLTAPARRASLLEVGMIGNEGMLGMFLSLGVEESPVQALVGREGTALRMATADFRHLLQISPGLLHVISRYCYVWVAQLVQRANCNRFHSLEQRLTRRLLMTHDRARSDEFHVTQKDLAQLLGVRRAGVNAAAAALQKRGLIRYHRGRVLIADRGGLEASACDCYAGDNVIYRKMLSHAWSDDRALPM